MGSNDSLNGKEEGYSNKKIQGFHPKHKIIWPKLKVLEISGTSIAAESAKKTDIVIFGHEENLRKIGPRICPGAHS